MTVEIYDPGFELRRAPAAAGPVPAGPARGTALGILDNGKPNFDELMDRVAARVWSRYGSACIEHRAKASAAHPVTPVDLRHLVRTCGLVFTGSAD